MMELMVVHPHIFWLSLGGLLLAAEMLGGNGYLLWSGVAAVITGLVVWLVPLGWDAPIKRKLGRKPRLMAWVLPFPM